jgi:hypothetical protein
LDRQINRKTTTTWEQGEAVVALWENYRDLVKALEHALADMLNYLIDPGAFV